MCRDGTPRQLLGLDTRGRRRWKEEFRRAFDVADAEDEVCAVIVTGAGRAGRRMTGAGCQARAAAALRRPWNRRRLYGDDRVE